MSTPLLSQNTKRSVAETCVHFNLKRSVRVITQQFNAALSQNGLHITQFTLLVTSSLCGTMSLTELAERLALDRTTLTRNLKPLEQKGLLHITVSDHDGRVHLVEITADGEALLAHSYPLWQSVQEELIQVFNHENYQSFLAQLKRLEACT